MYMSLEQARASLVLRAKERLSFNEQIYLQTYAAAGFWQNGVTAYNKAAAAFKEVHGATVADVLSGRATTDSARFARPCALSLDAFIRGIRKFAAVDRLATQADLLDDERLETEQKSLDRARKNRLEVMRGKLRLLVNAKPKEVKAVLRDGGLVSLVDDDLLLHARYLCGKAHCLDAIQLIDTQLARL